MLSHTTRYALLISLFVVPASAFAQRQLPAVEMSSALNSVAVFPALGTMDFSNDTQAVIAFMPAGAQVDAVLTKGDDDKTILHTEPYRIRPINPAFNALAPTNPPNFKLPGAGDYTLTWRVNRQPVTRLKFKAVFKKSGDVFDPKTVVFLEGPWEEWGYLFFPLNKGPAGDPQIRIWRQQMVLDGSSSSYRITAEIRKDGDVIAVSNGSSVGGQKQMDLQLALKHPASKGGRAFKAADLISRDGKYHVVILRDGKLDAVYPFEIKDNKPVPHERELNDYKEPLDHIVARYPGLANQYNAGDNIWMQRLSDAEAQRVYGGSAAPVAGPTDAQKAKWIFRPSVDPARRFQLTVTNVDTRSDTNLSAGDGVIAFGTGHPNGVKYLVAGESKAREIPDGETYNSRVFHVAGKKIVLVKRKQVYVYDTASGSTVSVSPDIISLYDEVGGLHHRNLINVDGHLVATVSDATAVKDGTIVKVIDLSGDQPVIIPIKNLDYTHGDVSSITLDAVNGHIAISSRQKKSIYVANIAPLANQRAFDLTDYQGVGSGQIALSSNTVVYQDSRDKLRSLNLTTGTSQAADLEAVGRTSRGFFMRGSRLAVATNEKYGSRYQFVTGSVSRLIKAGNLAEKLPETSGGMGMGGCAAIAEDGTVFIAGTDSIGVGEHLQALRGETWKAIDGADGKPLQACDITAGQYLVAFKSPDKAGQVKVGYATYGVSISLPGADGSPTSVANTNTPPKTTTTDPSTSSETGDGKTMTKAELEKQEWEKIQKFIEEGLTREEAEIAAIKAVNHIRAENGIPLKPVPGEDTSSSAGKPDDGETRSGDGAPANADAKDDEEGGGGLGTIILVIALLALLGGGGFFAFLQIRQANMGSTGENSAPPTES